VSQFCRAEGVTLFMAMLAAYATLLRRYTGQQDFCIGSGFASRRLKATEGLVGMLVNPVALRVAAGADSTFRDVVLAARDSVLAAASNQELPFTRLVAELNPDRDPAVNPVFQTMFSFDDSPLPELEFGAASATLFERHNGSAKMDLNVIVVPRAERRTGESSAGTDERITLLWEYDSDVFTRATVERMAERLFTVLEAGLQAPGLPIDDLDIASRDERAMVAAWADGGPPVAVRPSLPELIGEAVRGHAGRTAVVFGSRALSYRELWSRSGRVARNLKARGIGPGSIVGAMLGRCLELPVAMLGIMRAGGAYLPLDPADPVQRLDALVTRAGAALVITSDGGPRPAGVRCVTAAELKQDADGDLPAPAHPDELAYVLYTSGSTGSPKAVAATHRGLTNRICWMQDRYQLTADDRVLHKTPVTFDVSLWELLWPLAAGACLVIAPPQSHRDPRDLVGVINGEQVTTAHFVPPMLARFLDHPDAVSCTSLRLVCCSGQALSAELRDRFTRLLPARLENLYGPTEAAIDVTAFACEQTRKHGPGVPIGRPIPGVRALVLDPAMRPVPVGITGELYLGGVALARGYLNRPDLTADRFVPDPLSADGERIYRTGDLARWRADGALDFLGRTDLQLKVRGFRVEPVEVEDALRRHPAVADAVVTARPGPDGEARLVGYVTAAAGAAPGAGQLRAHLSSLLPEHLIPQLFCAIDFVPLTPHGKVDYPALPAPPAVTGQLFLAPRGTTEAALAEIWSEVLGVGRVGVHDGFFELGGHSLLGLRIVTRIAARLGAEVPLAAVFDNPTIGQLAVAVDGLVAPGPAADLAGAGREAAARELAAELGVPVKELAGLAARLADEERG
jgi:amino acid adenylation domain-containing protein